MKWGTHLFLPSYQGTLKVLGNNSQTDDGLRRSCGKMKIGGPGSEAVTLASPALSWNLIYFTMFLQSPYWYSFHKLLTKSWHYSKGSFPFRKDKFRLFPRSNASGTLQWAFFFFFNFPEMKLPMLQHGHCDHGITEVAVIYTHGLWDISPWVGLLVVHSCRGKGFHFLQ